VNIFNAYYSATYGVQGTTQCPLTMSDAGNAAAWACLDSQGTSVCYQALVENLRWLMGTYYTVAETGGITAEQASQLQHQLDMASAFSTDGPANPCISQAAAYGNITVDVLAASLTAVRLPGRSAPTPDIGYNVSDAICQMGGSSNAEGSLPAQSYSYEGQQLYCDPADASGTSPDTDDTGTHTVAMITGQASQTLLALNFGPKSSLSNGSRGDGAVFLPVPAGTFAVPTIFGGTMPMCLVRCSNDPIPSGPPPR
jgi:hypothetical protein